jgi:hypothetical protein
MAEFHLTGGWAVALRQRDGYGEGLETYAELRVSEYGRDSTGEVIWPPHTVMVGTFGAPGQLRELIYELERVHEVWCERLERERLARVAANEAAAASGWDGVAHAYLAWRRYHPPEEDGVVF